jgi:hypothetical protein
LQEWLGFWQVGKQVTINAKGDLILRPTYFEKALTDRGAAARDHNVGWEPSGWQLPGSCWGLVWASTASRDSAA